MKWILGVEEIPTQILLSLLVFENELCKVSFTWHRYHSTDIIISTLVLDSDLDHMIDTV